MSVQIGSIQTEGDISKTLDKEVQEDFQFKQKKFQEYCKANQGIIKQWIETHGGTPPPIVWDDRGFYRWKSRLERRSKVIARKN